MIKVLWCTNEKLGIELLRLPIEKFLIVVDEEDNEYVVDSIIKRKLHTDDDKEWYHALKIRKVDSGCIKR